MPTVPTGFVNQAQLSSEISKATAKLGRQVVRVRHSIGEDTSGEPSIFFRIVLSDSATSREELLADVTGRVATVIIEAIHPYEKWGLFPYFSFRSKSEQAMLSEPGWS